MSEEQSMFKPTAEASSRAWIKNMEQYQEMYDRSINDPEGFWGEIAEGFHWNKKWDKVWDYNFDPNTNLVEARIGRPATPGSVAGVRVLAHRETPRDQDVLATVLQWKSIAQWKLGRKDDARQTALEAVVRRRRLMDASHVSMRDDFEISAVAFEAECPPAGFVGLRRDPCRAVCGADQHPVPTAIVDGVVAQVIEYQLVVSVAVGMPRVRPVVPAQGSQAKAWRPRADE